MTFALVFVPPFTEFSQTHFGLHGALQTYMKYSGFSMQLVQFRRERNENAFHPLTHSSLCVTCAVCGPIAQLVRASHRHREGTGSNPVEGLNFQASLSSC